MKKMNILAVTGVIAMAIAMAGCGNSRQLNKDSGTENANAGMDEDASGTNADNNAGESAGDGKDGGMLDIVIEKDSEAEDKGMLYRDLQDNINKAEYPQGSSAFLMPVLQNPTDTTVTVQWFTEDEGANNEVLLYESVNTTTNVNTTEIDDAQEGLITIETNNAQTNADSSTTNANVSSGATPTRRVSASTFRLSRIRGGKTEGDCNNPKIKTAVYKHVAVIDNLPEYHGYVSERVNYRVSSDGETSEMYSLAAKAQPGTPMKVLLTSDLQIKNMCAANFTKVYETVGHVDAVLCNGDLVDVIDRAYDWFYADNAFYRMLTGTADDEINGINYKGAPFLQEAPIYTAIGNHDVMGVYDEETDLSVQFNNPKPREYAKMLSAASSTLMDENQRAHYIEDHSYNTITYEEMFGNKYYAASLGDIRLISLDVSRVWKLPNVGVQGKYSELPGATPNLIGYGDFIFESVAPGSPQVEFYKKELAAPEFTNAKYKLVMFHHEAHSLGDNSAPAFTDPVAIPLTDPKSGLPMTIYNYPKDKDYINTVLEPMAEAAGTNLMFNAHSHLWNRFKTSSGMNVLETSNVGNSYGAFADNDTPSPGNPASGRARNIPTALLDGSDSAYLKDYYAKEDYPMTGDPAGLSPIAPSIEAVPGNGPYVASNDLTVFSILDTKAGTVASYYFDTTKPGSEVIKFDEFSLQ